MIHMGSDHRCVMAKFEIPEKVKKKSRRNRASSVEIDGDTKEELTDQTREDGLEPIYKDLEQEVKDAEPEKVQKTATKKSSCSGGINCSTDGSSGLRRHHKEQCGSSRSNRREAQETKDKDEEILALIKERKMTEKHEKERIREISKKIKKCIREKKDDEASKNTEDLGITQWNKEYLQYQVGEKSEFSSQRYKKQKKRNHQHKKKALQMYSLNSTRFHMKTKKVKKTKRKNKVAHRGQKKCLINSTPSQNLQKARSKMLSTASRKEKQKTAVEYKLNSLKIAVTRRRKNQKILQRNHTTRRLHAEELAQDSYPSHLQERRQRRCRKLQADMWPTNTVKVVCNGTVRSTCARAAQSAAT